MRRTWKVEPRSFTMVVIVALSVALGFSLAANLYHHHNGAAIAAAPKAISENWRDGFASVADELAPSVVNITSEKRVAASPMSSLDDFFSNPFGRAPRRAPEQQQWTKGTGSGVVVRSDGYILTNNHVVDGAERVTVTLRDGRDFKGKVLLDPGTDLALVKIDAKDLPAAQFADSDKVKVGQWAIAIGNPYGLRNTVTAGCVSQVRRETDPNDQLPYPEVIQTDAPINPGNSGGPLVDIDGRIIGINGAIYTNSGGNVGIGFAIPSNTAKFVMTQLIEKGKVVRGFLGLTPSDLSPVMSEKLGVKSGALVFDVAKDSPAAKGGVKVKDVITSVNGTPVKSGIELRRTVQALAPGTVVKVVVVRDKKEVTLTVKLGEAPDLGGGSEADTGDKVGLSVQPLTQEMAKQLGIDESTKGVIVRRVEGGSPAERAGIRANDVITEIDDTPVTSVATFSKATKQLKSGDTAIVVVQRGERSVIIEMAID